MNHVTRLIACLTVALGLACANAPVAEAQTPGCVSQYELQRIDVGWQMARVHRVFDARGIFASWDWQERDVQIRSYRLCRNDGQTMRARYEREGPGRTFRLVRFWMN